MSRKKYSKVIKHEPTTGENLLQFQSDNDDKSGKPRSHDEIDNQSIISPKLHFSLTVFIVAIQLGMVSTPVFASYQESVDNSLRQFESLCKENKLDLSGCFKELLKVDFAAKVENLTKLAEKANSKASQSLTVAELAKKTAKDIKSEVKTLRSNVAIAESKAGAANESAGIALSTSEEAKSEASKAMSMASEAKKTADSVAAKAEDANRTAHAAVNTAQTAESKAEDANRTAHAAVNTAQTAESKAEDVNRTAHAAVNTAQTAESKAGAAQKEAEKAQRTAGTALANAKDAQDRANTALEKAETALINAQKAQDRANTAVDKAETALINAKDAQDRANTALGQAETAQTMAEEKAQQTADTVLKKVETAQTTADNALGKAQSAQSTANNNKNELDNQNDTSQTRHDEFRKYKSDMESKHERSHFKMSVTDELIDQMKHKELLYDAGLYLSLFNIFCFLLTVFVLRKGNIQQERTAHAVQGRSLPRPLDQEDKYKLKWQGPMENSVCVVSFHSETERLHARETRSVFESVGKSVPQIHSRVVRQHSDIQDLPGSKVFLVFVDFNERNVILEDPAKGLGNLRVTTVRSLWKFGADVTVIYCKDQGSRNLDADLFNRDLTSIFSHPELSILKNQDRMLSIFDELTDRQKQHCREIINQKLKRA